MSCTTWPITAITQRCHHVRFLLAFSSEPIAIVDNVSIGWGTGYLASWISAIRLGSKHLGTRADMIRSQAHPQALIEVLGYNGRPVRAQRNSPFAKQST